MTRLEQKIRTRIAEFGPITYRDFVETALFDPNDGYYRNGKPDHRDFLTSPEVHSVFGETIALYALCAADQVETRRFSVLELGGGSGRLGETIIKTAPSDRLARYVILERTRKNQRGSGTIEWICSVDELPVFDGFTFVIANEFFDALPFHRVMQDGELREICLGLQDGFLDILLPLSSDLAAFLAEFPLHLNEHQSLEVTPALAPLCSALSKKIERGALLVFDYGYHLEDIASGAFFDGSMVSYSNYAVSADVFSGIGQRDISHHVNFDHLTAILSEAGWTKNGETAQYRFLNAAGILTRIHSLTANERRAARMLLDPDGMGSTFRVLAFVKGQTISLPGF